MQKLEAEIDKAGLKVLRKMNEVFMVLKEQVSQVLGDFQSVRGLRKVTKEIKKDRKRNKDTFENRNE